jgi:hypothetical protein
MWKNIWQYGACVLHAGYQSLQTLSLSLSLLHYVILFCFNNGTNASECYSYVYIASLVVVVVEVSVCLECDCVSLGNWFLSFRDDVVFLSSTVERTDFDF